MLRTEVMAAIHECVEELKSIDERFEGLPLPADEAARWEKLVREAGLLSENEIRGGYAVPYSLHVETFSSSGYVTGDNTSQKAAYYAARERLAEQFERAVADQNRRTVVLEGGVKYEQAIGGDIVAYEGTPVVARIRGCTECGSQVMGSRCGKPECLELSDEEWAWRDLNEWWLGLDEPAFMHIAELETRIWAAMTNPPKRNRGDYLVIR